MKYCLLIFILISATCFSQTPDQGFENNVHNSTYYANTQSVHPLGLFISRVNNNFQLEADSKFSVATSFSSGNVWLPYVKAYHPLYEEDRAELRHYPWHEREWKYDPAQSPSRTLEFQADGLIREYQIMFNFPISGNHEIKVNNRMFSLDYGRIPYSLLTSDQFIEWFHSNVYGGEDPFARKAYGLNQANIHFTDAQGNSFQLSNGDFVFSGIDLSYYYYPDFKALENRDIYTNAGLQAGFNTSRINPSLDLGINLTLLKKLKLRNHARELGFGFSSAALAQKIARFGNSVELSNKRFLFTFELLVEYVKRFDNASYLSIAGTWLLQNSYYRNRDYDHLVLTGERTTTHWHYAISHLHRKLSSNSLVLTYAKGNIAFWLYLREDLLVDNAPDVQTGIGLRFFLGHSPEAD